MTESVGSFKNKSADLHVKNKLGKCLFLSSKPDRCICILSHVHRILFTAPKPGVILLRGCTEREISHEQELYYYSHEAMITA